ncbi:uncharacterized protein J8A68_004362 [[Candida] subhashii]|uniref:Protein FMP25, mitochondrial n=1 Tax=[Candida] subhashii TaxID=561895 RepID=A0A8J5QJW7_9ASCO|nr:uncharacterized protein J8A68_004362 [[Candida] subhashii]KAG7662100.1 hypothetical protein J8A68_004362 [[Candida] subhashii]
MLSRSRLVVRTLPISRRVLPKTSGSIRYVSSNNKEVKDDSDSKFDSIDEFNKHRVQYNFGHNFNELEDLEPITNPDVKREVETKQQNSINLDDEMMQNVNTMLEQDPRLAGLKPGSAKYKEILHYLHEEFQKQQQKERKRWEFNERMRGVLLGAVAVVGILSAHQIFMNYEYLKNKIMANITYKGVDESKAKDMASPELNTKKASNLKDALSNELHESILETVQDSKQVPGLYVFGSHNSQKLPARIPFFDNMLLKDVYVSGDYLAAVNDAGKVYELYKGLQEPQLVNLPFKVQSIGASGPFLYFLTNKGQVNYIPRGDQKVTNFLPTSTRNWIGLLKQTKYATLSTQDPIKQMSTGKDHLTLLTTQGKILIVNSNPTNPENYGQFGPAYSPYDKSKAIPFNQPIDITLLNNEIVIRKDGTKFIQPRVFSSIAAGQHFNIASDQSGNIWTWGKNLSGQCGVELSETTELRPIPKVVLTKEDFKRICRSSLDANPNTEEFSVREVFAGDESSYILLNYADGRQKEQDIVLSFGNGINGQLGGNRYLHVCSKPQVMKSLLGLTEYDEVRGKSVNIGIKDLNVGNKHLFVTLDTVGEMKDVLAVGENEHGQFGNGKRVKSSKPLQIPKLIEPEDVENNRGSMNKLVKKINDIVTNRLSMLHDHKLPSGANVEQVIVASDDASAIFYRRK